MSGNADENWWVTALKEQAMHNYNMRQHVD
jgi:hypothetical protein